VEQKRRIIDIEVAEEREQKIERSKKSTVKIILIYLWGGGDGEEKKRTKQLEQSKQVSHTNVVSSTKNTAHVKTE
jgi:hypothetical protein